MSILNYSGTRHVAGGADRNLTTCYSHTCDNITCGKSRIRVATVGQWRAVVNLGVAVSRDSQRFLRYFQGTCREGNTVITHRCHGTRSHINTVNLGNDIGLRANICDGAGVGHHHQEGVTVAGFQCTCRETGLRQSCAVIGLAGILGSEQHILAVHCQHTRVNCHAVVASKSWGYKGVSEGVLHRTDIGNGGVVGEIHSLSRCHSVTTNGHHLLLERCAVVCFAVGATRQGDLAAVHLQGTVVEHHIVAAAHILGTVVDCVACRDVVHARGHILHLAGDGHFQRIAVGELIDTVGRDRNRNGRTAIDGQLVAVLGMDSAIVHPLAVVGSDDEVLFHTLHRQRAIDRRHTVVVGGGGRCEGVTRDGIGHRALARELDAAHDDRSDGFAAHHTVTREGVGRTGLRVAIVGEFNAGGIDGDFSAVYGQSTGIDSHAVVGGKLAGSQGVGEGVLLAAPVFDGGEVVVGGLLAAQPAATGDSHGVVGQIRTVVLLAGGCTGQHHIAADNMLRQIISHIVVADALVGGKRRGDRGSGTVHIVTFMDIGRGHSASRHGVAAHQTSDRVADGCGGVVAHKCGAVVDLRTVKLDGQRRPSDAHRVGAYCRSVVAVLGLHIDQHSVHIGDARSDGAPRCAVQTVIDRGTRRDSRFCRINHFSTVKHLGGVVAVQDQITAVGDGQLTKGSINIIVAGDIQGTAHHFDAGAKGVSHRTIGHVGDGARNSHARDDVAIGQGHIAARGAGVALRAEGYLITVVAVGTAVIGPAMVVGLDGQRGGNLLDGGGSRDRAAVGVSHLKAIGTISQIDKAVAAGGRHRVDAGSSSRQLKCVVGHTTGDSVVEETIRLTVAVAGGGIDGQGYGGRDGHAHLNGVLVAAKVFHIDLHRQCLCGGGQGDGVTGSRALRNDEIGIRCAKVRGDSLHARLKVRIAVVAACHYGGQRGGVARANDRLGLVTTLVGDGVGHWGATVGDGIFTLDFPVAVVGANHSLHRVHRQGLAARGGVESLHGSLRREGRLVGVAGVHTRLVARPGTRQSGSRWCCDVVGVGPIMRVSAGTVSIGPRIGLGAGAAVEGAASHRTSDIQRATIVGWGGGRCRHRGVGSTRDIAASIGRQREVALGDGIDIVPCGGQAGAVSVGVGVSALALTGERVGTVRSAGEHTIDGLVTLAGGRRDGGRSLGAVHTGHRLGSLNARGVHRRSYGAVDGIDIFPYELAVHTILVRIGVGNRTLATRDVLGSHWCWVSQCIAAYILHHRKRGGSNGVRHTFHRSRRGHRSTIFSRRRGTGNGISINPVACMTGTVSVSVGEYHITLTVHRIGGTLQCPCIRDVLTTGIGHCRHHARNDKMRSHRIGHTLDGTVGITTRESDVVIQLHHNVGGFLTLTTILVHVINHIRVNHSARCTRHNCCASIDKVSFRNRIIMGYTVGNELPGNSVNVNGHTTEGSCQQLAADIGANRVISQRDRRYGMCGYIHTNRHNRGGTHTRSVLRNHRIFKGSRRGSDIHQVLTVNGVLKYGSSAGISTRNGVGWCLGRESPGVCSTAVVAGRSHHKGTS